MHDDTHTQQLRRQASKLDLQLKKVREGSRDYWQYGPFLLVDAATNSIVAYGLDLDAVEAELTTRA